LLPVDAQNTQKLLKALDSAVKDKAALARLRPQSLAQSYSTAVEGDITIDLLFRAAGLSFEDVRDYLKQVNVDGTCVTTLDVDGLLLTKQTDRISDAADRYKLERYRQSERDLALMMERIQRLNDLPDKSGVAQALWSEVNQAIEAAGSVLNADWPQVENQTIECCIGVHGENAEALANFLCQHSPSAIHQTQQNALRQRIANMAARL
jgi:DNA-binding transcriptional MerR regulator